MLISLALNDLPLVTIITVVFNGANSIEQTIQSVINQPYKNLNYIIIDGGSNDGTQEIIKQYEQHLFYWISEKDKGIYDAMNKGWIKAKDESYILYIGSGDKILQLPNMNKHLNDAIIYGNVEIGKKYVFNTTVDFRLKWVNALHHQALLVKKKLHINPPFSLEYPVFSDFDFNQRLYKKGIDFVKDDEFLSYAMEGGVSEYLNKKEIYSVIKKNFGPVQVMLAAVYYFLHDTKNKLTGFNNKL